MNNFDGVKTSGSIDVELKNGTSTLVEVEGDDNVIPYVITKVENGLLDVYYKPGSSFNNVQVKVYVTAPSFSKILVKGSGSIVSKDNLKGTNTIEMKVSGSGDIIAILDAPAVKADIAGSGSINLEGRTRNLNCSISGSGDLKGQKLLSENTSVNVSGSGNAHIFASVALKAKISGSGDIYYGGNPPSPEIQKSGSGSVQPE